VSNIVIKCTEPVPGSYTPVCLLSSILCLPSSILCHLSSMLCLLSSMPFLVSSTLYSKSSILCRLSFILGLSSSRLWFLSTILCLMFYMICFNSSIHCLLSFTTFLLSSIVCNGRWNERSGRLSFGGLKNGLRSWTESQGPLGPRDSVQLQRPFWTPPNDRRPQFSFQRPAYCYICDCHKSSEVRQEKRTMAASFDVCRKYNSMIILLFLQRKNVVEEQDLNKILPRTLLLTCNPRETCRRRWLEVCLSPWSASVCLAVQSSPWLPWVQHWPPCILWLSSPYPSIHCISLQEGRVSPPHSHISGTSWLSWNEWESCCSSWW